MITNGDITERFERVLDHLRRDANTDGPDGSVPGASSGPARYAVLTFSERWGYFLNYAETLTDVETAAKANIEEGWNPVAYYDLFDLDGDDPDPEPGDIVSLNGGAPTEIVDADTKDDELTLTLASDTDSWCYAYECSIVERVNSEDYRLPPRYEVARVVTSVTFNTVPSR